MIFEWDDKKNKSNLKKHDVSFEEGRTIFYDPNVLTKPDPDHSEQEERWLSIGISENLRVLLVVHLELTSDSEPHMRIISARKATKLEKLQYAKIAGIKL